MRAGERISEERLAKEYPELLERTIARAIAASPSRHIHPNGEPCHGCVTRAASAVRRQFSIVPLPRAR